MQGLPVNEVKDLGTAITNQGERKTETYKHSGFFITVSTNYRPKADEDAAEVAELLRKAMGEMLSNQGLAEVIEFLEAGSFTKQYIKTVEGEFIVERGRNARGGRIHSHASLHITHRSKIRMNIPAMKEFLMERLSSISAIKSVYINVKAIGSDKLIRDYLRKELHNGGGDDDAAVGPANSVPDTSE